MNEQNIQIIDSLLTKKDSLLLNNIDFKLVNHATAIIENNNAMGITDWVSFWSGVAGVLITVLFGIIAWQFSKEQKKQNRILQNSTDDLKTGTETLNKEIKELKELENDIRKSVNTVVDINRNVKTSFPTLMSTIKELCNLSIDEENVEKFYIMNRTSSFGKIHIYNPRFIRQYLKLQEIENEEDAKIAFYKDIEEVNRLIMTSADNVNNFKLMVFNGEGENNCLEKEFIDDYFEKEDSSEDIERGDGLTYYEIDKDLNYKLNSFPNLTIVEKRDKIKNSVVGLHNKVINKIREIKKSRDFLIYDERIPMQIYLLKYTKNNKPVYNSLTIFAEDEEIESDKKRTLIGVLSREKNLFNTYETIYEHYFEKKQNQ